jgi:tripeptidyl-peptidase-1
MKLTVALLLTLALVASTCQAIETNRKAPTLPAEWVKAKKAVNDDTEVMVTLTLRQQNLDELRQIASDVSEPTHAKYGQHLTMKQVHTLTKPTEETYQIINTWFDESGAAITNIESLQGGSVLRLTMSAKDVKVLFKTTVTYVQLKGTKEMKIRAGDITIPSKVAKEISAIFGLHGLPLPKQSKFIALKSGGGGSPAKVTPTVIGKTYNASDRRGTAGKASRQAVGEYQGQDALDTDTASFFKQYVPNAKQGDEKLFKVVGTNDQGSSGVEAALDVEYIMGVAPGVLTEFWGYQQQDFCGDLQKFSQKILDTEDAPNVFSISYGWQGKLSQLGCQDSEVQAVDVNFQKLAARGVSMIIASGDTGAAWTPGFFKKGQLFPSWPASSPWVTAVGATRFINQDPSQAEQASDQFGSGGGFSKDFDRTNATWQEAHVTGYLKLADKLPPTWAFTASGRATPDVSALGEGFMVVSGGRSEPVGGTSASTPLFAGLVSLLNDVRVSKGKKPMGFLNPFIYSNPQAFTDVTVGNNAIDRSGFPAKYGFQCTKGWDPVSGMGTPKFGALLEAAMK